MRYAPGKLPTNTTPSTAGLGDIPLEKIRQMQAENAPKIVTRPTLTAQQPVRPAMPNPDPNLPFVINDKRVPNLPGTPSISGIRPPGKGTTGGPLVKPPLPGMAGLGQAMSNLGIKKGIGPMIGKKFGGLGMKKGGAVKKKAGGSVSSASKRADGCAIKGKTKGKIV